MKMLAALDANVKATLNVVTQPIGLAPWHAVPPEVVATMRLPGLSDRKVREDHLRPNQPQRLDWQWACPLATTRTTNTVRATDIPFPALGRRWRA